MPPDVGRFFAEPVNLLGEVAEVLKASQLLVALHAARDFYPAFLIWKRVRIELRSLFQFQTGHVQQYLRYLKDLVLRQRDVLERAKQELIAYKELQRCVRRFMAVPFCVCTRYMACLSS